MQNEEDIHNPQSFKRKTYHEIESETESDSAKSKSETNIESETDIET